MEIWTISESDGWDLTVSKISEHNFFDHPKKIISSKKISKLINANPLYRKSELDWRCEILHVRSRKGNVWKFFKSLILQLLYRSYRSYILKNQIYLKVFNCYILYKKENLLVIRKFCTGFKILIKIITDKNFFRFQKCQKRASRGCKMSKYKITILRHNLTKMV